MCYSWVRRSLGIVIVSTAIPMFAPGAFGQILQIGELLTARRGHTATLLNDGRVLFVGGEDQTRILGTSELLVPDTGVIQAGPAISPRTDHTATLLPNGKVLVAGGRNASGPLASSVLFDPRSTSWSPGPKLTRPRAGHTSTALADGRIILIGGDPSGTAEIYDPATGGVTGLSARLNAPRSFHAAALLPSGEVLVVGGAAPDDTLRKTAERYDPAGGLFADIPGQMLTGRFAPAIRVLPDGKVQVIGGDDAISMEMFEPDARLFRALTHLPPNVTMIADTLAAQTRAALFATTIRQDPNAAGATEDTLVLLDREDHSLTEARRDRAVVAGGTDSTGQRLRSLAILSSSTATVTTEHTDYKPGQTVVITGRGWRAAEPILLTIREEPETHPDTTLVAVADADGVFTNSDFAPVAGDRGRAFTITAVGQSSGRVAQTAFADSVGVNLDQCQNIDLTHLNDPCGTTPGTHPTWTNGSINGSNSEYREADGLPYRLAITGLTSGDWTVRLDYDFTQGGKVGVDRLTSYSLTQAANPCLDQTDVSPCNVAAPAFTFAIPGEVAAPSATQPALPNGGALVIAGTAERLTAAGSVMSVWVEGGTAAFQSAGQNQTGVWSTSFTDGFVKQNGSAAANSDREFAFRFSLSGCPAAGCDVIVGWTGHLAAGLDWGAGMGASSISGAAFHMRVVGVDNLNGTGGGNQDRSAQISALVQPANIVIKKVTQPSSDTTTSFGFTASGGLSPSTFALRNGEQITFGSVSPGMYTVTEGALPSGWTLTNITCVDPSGNTTTSLGGASASIDVAEGETVTCTFTNTMQGSIVVDKATVPPGDPQSFTFSTTGAGYSGFSLTDTAPPNQQLVTPGSYSVTETTVAGWMLSSLTCVSQLGTSTADTASPPTATITLAAGDTVTCTFTNTKSAAGASIVVDKVTVPSGDPQSFTFSTIGGGYSDFSLTDAAPPNQQFVTPGSYSVTETAVAGWMLSSLTCVSQLGISTADTASPPTATITLAAGDTVTCTFTNTKAATLTVNKVLSPADDPGRFDLQVDGVTVGTGSNVGNGGTTGAVRVPIGPHVAGEIAAPGTTLSDYTVSIGGDCDSAGNVTLAAGENKTCVITNTAVQTQPPDFCSKAAVSDVLNPTSGRFPSNKGLDRLVRVDLGESIQAAVDGAADSNGDGYILIGVVAGPGTPAPYGGNTTQSVAITRQYPEPFGLIGCSVTMHDGNLADGLPTGLIAASAGSPTTVDNPSTIFVMDLHAADSDAAGWKVEGDGRELRSVDATGNAVGLWVVGNNNVIHNGVIANNRGVGILIQGAGNLVDSADSMGNLGHGVQVIGDANQLVKVDVGDIGKGNRGHGVAVSGGANILTELSAFANAGSGINVAGAGNQLLKNAAGDNGKGNGANGIWISGPGNLLQENRANANTTSGFDVSGGGAGTTNANRLRSNLSNTGLPGSATENRGAEYRLQGYVYDYGGGNKADNIVIPKTTSPTKCPLFPKTDAIVNFTTAYLCE